MLALTAASTHAFAAGENKKGNDNACEEHRQCLSGYCDAFTCKAKTPITAAEKDTLECGSHR